MGLALREYAAPQRAYELSDATITGLPCVRAQYNEGTGARLPWKELQKALRRYRKQGLPSLYPDHSLLSEFKKQLAEYSGVQPEQVQVFHGSDALLEKVALVASLGRLPFRSAGPSPGRRASFLVLGPTYSQALNLPARLGCRVVEARGPAPFFRPDPGEFASVIESLKPDVVYICNPNNPTGLVTKPEIIKDLCKRNPETLFLLDEAYVEFDGLSSAGLISSLSNLAVARTFSKAFALADQRLGYLLAGQTMQNVLKPFVNDKDVTTESMIYGLGVLRNPGYMHDYVKAVRGQRCRVADILKSHGFEPLSEAGNFVAFHVPQERTRQFLERCEYYGLQLRDLSRLSPGMVRISLIGETETDYFERVFPRFSDPGSDRNCAWLDWGYPQARDRFLFPPDISMMFKLADHLWELHRRRQNK